MERRINGICILPDNGFYALAYILRNAKVMGFQRNNVSHREHVLITITLSSSYSSALRAAVAIILPRFFKHTSTTLYKAIKGPQINQYGFATFGLTASPFQQ